MVAALEVLVVPVDPDAAVGTLILARSGGTRVLVARHAQGWSAVLDLCPHARCSLAKTGEVVEGTILV